jgi:hypothetical protein
MTDQKAHASNDALAKPEAPRPVKELVDALPPEMREALPPWAKKLAYVLDDLIRIPGLDRGVGLDALVGLLIPGAGDAMTALGSTSLLVLALQRRVPFVILVQMVMNIGIDSVLGAVPVLGDIFDVFFRSNRRNLELIEQHQGIGSAPTAKDYAIVGAGFGLAVISVVLPIALAITLGVKLAEWMSGY